MATHKPLLPRAILENIEVKGGIEDGKRKMRSQYSVRLYVADRVVAKATCKRSSSLLKWKWTANNEIWYEPSSTMKVMISRGFDVDIKQFNYFVGQYEGKVVDMLENNAELDLMDKKGIPIPINMKITLSPISHSADYIKEFMERVDADVARLPKDGAVLGAVSTLGQVLKLTKSIMDKFTQAHPILSASWSVVSILYQAVQETVLQDESIRELANTLRELLGIADAVPNLRVIPSTIDVIREISRQSLQVASVIHEFTKLSFASRTLKVQISEDVKTRIAGCQQRCAALKETFHTRLHLDTHAQVDKIKRTVDLIKDDVLESKINTWLSPPDHFKNREEAHGKRQVDTCSWFLDSELFLRWRKEPGFIWVKGKSGCGKSILCSSIIDTLPQPTSSLGIAHFFFDGRDGQRELQFHNKFIRSLISQISDMRHGGIPVALADLYKNCGSQQPLTDQLQKVLHDILSSFSQAYIVIDALDECIDREKTIAWINELVTDTRWKATNLHIMVTSRPESDIDEVFKALDPDSIDVGKATANGDIDAYLEREIGSKFQKFDEDTRKEIESGLRERADGSFRWVALQFAELRNCLSEYEVKQRMQDLPTDLDDIYKRILKAVDGRYRADTITFLEWLSFSKRPVTVAEISEAIAVDFNSVDGPVFNAKKRYKNPWDMLVRCSSLVTESEGTVKLSHFSVKEYLLSDRIERDFSISEKAAHVKFSEVSVAYLLQFDSFEPLTKATLGSSPLAGYAAEFWIDHAKSGGMGTTLLKLIFRLFTANTAALTNWIRIYDIDYHYYDERQDLSMDKAKVCSPLYYASLAGMHQVSKHLLKNGSDVNTQGGGYGNTLQAASQAGHEVIVKLLLENGADVNAQGGRYNNALEAASFIGHGAVVKLLLEKGADVNAQREEYGNALQAASSSGHEVIVKFLLDNGADINAQGGQYGNALQAASQGGHEAVVKLLLENGADAVSGQQGEYSNPLQSASEGGHETIVKLLLRNGADVNAQTEEYGSALQAASFKGHEAVVKLLLEKGADVNAQGGPFGNALQAASSDGREAVVKLLLDNEADVNTQGGSYGNALQAASSDGTEAIVRLLLENGADINVQGGWYGNTLQAASATGHEEIVKLLLENGADVNAQGEEYGSALQAASLGGHEAVVKLLLENGADVNALQAASLGGHEAVVKLLLEKGEDVNGQGGWYGNALQAASSSGYEVVVQLLLEKGANVNAQGGEYGNALQAASSRGWEGVVQLLLKKGAEVNAQGGEYSNALQAASEAEHEEIVKLLLEKGADVESVDMQAVSDRMIRKLLQDANQSVNPWSAELLCNSHGSPHSTLTDIST